MKDVSEVFEAWEMWYSDRIQTLKFLQAFLFLSQYKQKKPIYIDY